MEDLLVSDLSKIEIKSYKGTYSVDFIDDPFKRLEDLINSNVCLIIDKNVSELYKVNFAPILEKTPYIIVEATEENKDLSKFTDLAVHLVQLGVKRNVTLVAIGGGITQDITCFLAATLFRGLNWIFFPTTLLAQADSCIGSKSSINVGGIKNLMGTFTPPNQIYISVQFLKTLKSVEIFSGLGEMIKVHGIAGVKKLTEFSENYDQILSNNIKLQYFLIQSLLIKKEIIEKDEFDIGPRLVMNYGHTFGHAIESATNYEIPHGIAVTIGQSMACQFSLKQNFISQEINQLAQNLFNKNLSNFNKYNINFEAFIGAIRKDKKNVGHNVSLIIPKNNDFKIEKYEVPTDSHFIQFCKNYFLEKGFHVI